jgi:hypothetical protein
MPLAKEVAQSQSVWGWPGNGGRAAQARAKRDGGTTDGHDGSESPESPFGEVLKAFSAASDPLPTWAPRLAAAQEELRTLFRSGGFTALIKGRLTANRHWCRQWLEAGRSFLRGLIGAFDAARLVRLTIAKLTESGYRTRTARVGSVR